MVRILSFALGVLLCFGVSAKQDPTAPLDWTQAKPASSGAKKVYYRVPTLQSIICDDGSECRAVVNNQIVSKGQSVSGYKVMEINRQQVALARGSKTWNLELFSQVKKN